MELLQRTENWFVFLFFFLFFYACYAVVYLAALGLCI